MDVRRVGGEAVPVSAWSEPPEVECLGCEICGTCFELEDDLAEVDVPIHDPSARRPAPPAWAH